MLTGVHNFRDFGGYRTNDGRRLKSGRLFRSARLAEATTDDEAELRALGLTTIVDLRRKVERSAHPTGAWSVRHEIITNDLDGEVDPWLPFLKKCDVSATVIRGYFTDFYRNAPYEKRHIDLFSRYFHALANKDGALLVHCMGGKDRTGIIVALTHDLLGVARADIITDYLLTNQHWTYESHGGPVTQFIAEETGQKPDEAAIRAVMEVEAEFLDITFEAIRARSGSIESYFEDVLALSAQSRDAIVARLTEPAAISEA